ncbi:hypothetical protein Cflav_PD0912 [Pedosphaera parvula Ellin514]|uniref:Uncharacterized protein n=1 Tax=Pedosphaera parvula (strain Ellin514) TaxID=320771 RepID=B9XQV5_PEDPL|nr:hypothetical protein Cflav_PD0912 [Pedosphaera parvula Ellin514]
MVEGFGQRLRWTKERRFILAFPKLSLKGAHMPWLLTGVPLALWIVRKGLEFAALLRGGDGFIVRR